MIFCYYLLLLLCRILVAYFCLFGCTTTNFRILVRPLPCISQPILPLYKYLEQFYRMKNLFWLLLSKHWSIMVRRAWHNRVTLFRGQAEGRQEGGKEGRRWRQRGTGRMGGRWEEGKGEGKKRDIGRVISFIPSCLQPIEECCPGFHIQDSSCPLATLCRTSSQTHQRCALLPSTVSFSLMYLAIKGAHHNHQ